MFNSEMAQAPPACLAINFGENYQRVMLTWHYKIFRLSLAVRGPLADK